MTPLCADCGQAASCGNGGSIGVICSDYCNSCLSARYVVPERRNRRAYFFTGPKPVAADLHGDTWVAAVTGKAVARANRQAKYGRG